MPIKKTKKGSIISLAAVKKIDAKKLLSLTIIAYKTIKEILLLSFVVLWIIIGGFFIWFIGANFSHGSFEGLMKKPQAETAASEKFSPTEVNLPGVGQVNVSCVQGSLPEESIVKVIQQGNTDSLTADEKAELEKCKVTSEAPSQ